MNEINLQFDINSETKEPELKSPSTNIYEIESLEEENNLQQLSTDEIKMVNNFIKTIDLNDTVNVTSYGKSTQSKISDFSTSILNEVKLKDTGEVGDCLMKLISTVNSLEEEESKGLFKLFKKSKNDISSLMQKFSTAEISIEQISNTLDKQKISLLKDIKILDEMYEHNKNYFKELTLYIVAGEEKLKEYRNEDIVKQQALVEQGNSQVETQNLNDMIQSANRFEKRLHDLKLTKTISLQMAPQIRMLQNNNIMLVDKIDSSILNTIPLWRNQMVLSLGINNNKKALELQKSVTDATNEMLKKNSELLKQGTIELAKENERGIVDVDTLKETNKNLIDTINEVIQIQKEGVTNRANAEKELLGIENELKQALLQVTK